MKRLLILIYICVGATAMLHAQTFTLEYNLGYGTFDMSDMKDYLKRVSSDVMPGIKNTDNFGGHFTHEGRIGVLLKRHHTGIVLGYQNTAGQDQIADYSGEVKVRFRNYGYKLGGFYRYMLAGEGKVVPFLDASVGVLLNHVDGSTYMRILDESAKDEVELRSLNMFFQPGVGVQYKFHQRMAIQATLGYELDPLQGLLHLKGNKKAKSFYKSDWGGVRISAGIIAFL